MLCWVAKKKSPESTGNMGISCWGDLEWCEHISLIGLDSTWTNGWLIVDNGCGAWPAISHLIGPYVLTENIDSFNHQAGLGKPNCLVSLVWWGDYSRFSLFPFQCSLFYRGLRFGQFLMPEYWSALAAPTYIIHSITFNLLWPTSNILFGHTHT